MPQVAAECDSYTLDAAQIRDLFDVTAASQIQDIAVHQCLDSTNLWLLQRASEGAPIGTVCLAKQQTAGRGRHGRTWISPASGNLYLSLLWRYPLSARVLGGLSLACGVAVLRALSHLGAVDIALKWPNDLLWAGCKLAGLLLEMRSEAASGTTTVIIGVGINVRMQSADTTQIDQPWTALEQIGQISEDLPSRNRLAALVLSELVAALLQFQIDGLTSFLADWKRYDALKGQRVQVAIGTQYLEGDYLGITEDGALQLAVGAKIIPCYGGEVRRCRVMPH